MFDKLTTEENTTLWRKLEHATDRLHSIPRDMLSEYGYMAVAAAELEILDIREDLTKIYAARADAELAAVTGKGGTTDNGTRYCRTCGFTDCPGATTGDCPRWPADA